MNRHQDRAWREPLEPEEPEEMSPEEKEKLENQLQSYADDAASPIFKRVRESARAMVQQSYLVLAAEKTMLAIGREQGVIAGLNALIEDYESAAQHLADLQRDTGQEEQGVPAPPIDA